MNPHDIVSPFSFIVIVAGVLAFLLVMAIVVLGYSIFQMRRLAADAYAYIKADSVEQKVRTDGLDRTLRKIEKIAPPRKRTPEEEERAADDKFKSLARNGEVLDSSGKTFRML